ncbi:DUF4189 domain-containing protein [Achromobacter arsenitoxydans]|nr:DUF4189 domain-containing protein [Achromobacter arsenitoxydans]
MTTRDFVPLPRRIPGLPAWLLLLAGAAAYADTPRPIRPDLAPAASESPAQPRDLHGALIVSSNYRYYASILYGSESDARRSALAACRESEPDATCKTYSSFKNRCIAVAGNGPHHFVATGKEGWDLRQTRDVSLRLCKEKTGSSCKLLISACSTQAQKDEDQKSKNLHAGAVPRAAARRQ